MSDEQEGPHKVVKTSYYCTGCKYLKTKEWSFMGENDDLDSGTDADCSVTGRNISSYYFDNHTATPDWCPYLKEKNNV